MKQSSMVWGMLLLLWFLALCIVPDPRPLGAPEWAVNAIRFSIGLSEPVSRAVATIALRGMGIGVIGVLLSLTLANVRISIAAPVVVLGAALLAIVSQWVNYGYFPISAQIQLGLVSAILGSLTGLALRRSVISLVVLVVFALGLFLWGTSTGISDDLEQAASATARHLLDHSDDIPDGDEGFAELLRMAFTFAEDNSHGRGAVEPNKAAILALGVILGEEKVARVAKREIDISVRPEIKALYRRISVRGRNDLVRHFWVSAALTVLSDENRSMAVGITKELMDATPGGTGFSFVDLTADRAGTLFAIAATRTNQSAHEMQMSIRQGVDISDFFPEIDGLPEGLSRDQFQDEYGGLGGEKTQGVVEEIRGRLAACRGLNSGLER